MKFCLTLSSLLALLSTQLVFAATCPSIAAIKQTGFNEIIIDQNGWLARFNNNKYDTDSLWTFTLQGRGDVNNENEARQKAMREVRSLVLVDGPIYVKSSPSYMSCIYKTNKSQAAARSNL
jgi:hypothetical protein